MDSLIQPKGNIWYSKHCFLGVFSLHHPGTVRHSDGNPCPGTNHTGHQSYTNKKGANIIVENKCGQAKPSSEQVTFLLALHYHNLSLTSEHTKYTHMLTRQKTFSLSCKQLCKSVIIWNQYLPARDKLRILSKIPLLASHAFGSFCFYDFFALLLFWTWQRWFDKHSNATEKDIHRSSYQWGSTLVIKVNWYLVPRSSSCVILSVCAPHWHNDLHHLIQVFLCQKTFQAVSVHNNLRFMPHY